MTDDLDAAQTASRRLGRSARSLATEPPARASTASPSRRDRPSLRAHGSQSGLRNTTAPPDGTAGSEVHSSPAQSQTGSAQQAPSHPARYPNTGSRPSSTSYDPPPRAIQGPAMSLSPGNPSASAPVYPYAQLGYSASSFPMQVVGQQPMQPAFQSRPDAIMEAASMQDANAGYYQYQPYPSMTAVPQQPYADVYGSYYPSVQQQQQPQQPPQAQLSQSVGGPAFYPYPSFARPMNQVGPGPLSASGSGYNPAPPRGQWRQGAARSSDRQRGHPWPQASFKSQSQAQSQSSLQSTPIGRSATALLPAGTSGEGPSPPSSRGQRAATQPRTDFVMWVGNVPSNATQEELWSLFRTLSPDSTGDEPVDSEASHGIISIFIISRSNCAFVNYATADHLSRAVDHFQGGSIRPEDPRCPRLVCRVRKKDDETQTGAAGQKGKGFHRAWLKEHDGREKRREAEVESVPGAEIIAPGSITDSAASVSSEGLSAGETAISRPSNIVSGNSHSSGSADISYASTNSSLLRNSAFNQRYFILKSHNIEALDEAVKTSRWATQPHNEPVLDQALRNSENVYLIFSANQSGSFFGCAKMKTPCVPRKGREDSQSAEELAADPIMQVTSPPQLTPADHGSESDPLAAATAGLSLNAPQSGSATTTMASQHSSNVDQPGSQDTAVGEPTDAVLRRDMIPPASASSDTPPSAELSTVGETNTPVSSTTPSLGPADSVSYDAKTAAQTATRAIIHNLRLEQRASQLKAEELERQLVHDDAVTDAAMASKGAKLAASSGSTPSKTPTVVADPASEQGRSSADASPAEPLGHPFELEWVLTTALPFSMVKNLRNAWNENKSVRVARDGTEIAIDTGAELLKIWKEYAEDLERRLNLPQTTT